MKIVYIKVSFWNYARRSIAIIIFLIFLPAPVLNSIHQGKGIWITPRYFVFIYSFVNMVIHPTHIFKVPHSLYNEAVFTG